MPDLSLQHRFELITAPAVEPVTVTTAKKQMRIKNSDDDALIARLVNSGIGFVDLRGALDKAISTQTRVDDQHPRLPHSVASTERVSN